MKSVKEIVIPQLAESLVSATIDKWLKQPGDRIEMYEPICELITDKVKCGTAVHNCRYAGRDSGRQWRDSTGRNSGVPCRD